MAICKSAQAGGPVTTIPSGQLPQGLTPEKALIFRVTHVSNVPWILANGLHCCNSKCTDPGFRQIGNPELIEKRAARPVPIAPRGMLSDYVPFYFTPFSPMLLNIKTGYNGMKRTPMSDIAILISSLRKVRDEGLGFVFTDRHAYLEAAQFSSDLERLDWIPWSNLQGRDFRRNPDDPAKFERYQAEALVHRMMPVSVLLGVACYDKDQVARIQEAAAGLSLSTNVVIRPEWYF
jgi:hypothetical protein